MNNSRALPIKIIQLGCALLFSVQAFAADRCVEKLAGLKGQDKAVAEKFAEITGNSHFTTSNWKSANGSNFTIAESNRATILKLKGVPAEMIPALAKSANLAEPDGKVSTTNMMILRAVLNAGMIQFNASMCLKDDTQAKVILNGTGKAKGKVVTLLLSRDADAKLKISLEMGEHQSEAVFDSY